MEKISEQKKSVLQASILLAAVFGARGTSFMFSKTLMESIPPMSILGVRFVLSFLILAVVFHKRILHVNKKTFLAGVILGFCYTVCMVFEMYGLRLVDSGVSSLIENMAIVLVPLYTAVLTRTLPAKKTLLCAMLAVAGVAFLSLTQTTSPSGTLGIVLTVCAALTYGACIMATAHFSKESDAIAVGIIQIGTMGVVSGMIALISERPALPHGAKQWGYMLILILLCSCFGFAFQPLAQKRLKAETAAIYSVFNPLTASILGIVAAGESVSVLKLIGYAFIITALLVYQIRFPKKREKC